MFGKRKRVKELETELRILYSELWRSDKTTGFHARHNKKFKRYAIVISELERISLKWKIKKFFRRLKK